MIRHSEILPPWHWPMRWRSSSARRSRLAIFGIREVLTGDGVHPATVPVLLVGEGQRPDLLDGEVQVPAPLHEGEPFGIAWPV